MSFQSSVRKWVEDCFGVESADEKAVRNRRFLEEALELVQSLHMTEEEAFFLVEYVFNREKGEPEQEVGGTMTTLAALCSAYGFDMDALGQRELTRCEQSIDKIREKNVAKPRWTGLDTPYFSPKMREMQSRALASIYLREISEHRRRIQHLERQRDDLHETTNRYLERARSAEGMARRNAMDTVAKQLEAAFISTCGLTDAYLSWLDDNKELFKLVTPNDEMEAEPSVGDTF